MVSLFCFIGNFIYIYKYAFIFIDYETSYTKFNKKR